MRLRFLLYCAGIVLKMVTMLSHCSYFTLLFSRRCELVSLILALETIHLARFLEFCDRRAKSLKNKCNRKLHLGPAGRKIESDPFQSQYLHLDVSGFLVYFNKQFHEVVFS